jgi:hypothetical protein
MGTPIYHLNSRNAIYFAHPHVQDGFKPGGKTAFSHIELVRGDSEISKDPIYFPNAIEL